MIDLHALAQKMSQRTHHRVEDWHSVMNAVVHDPAFSQMTDGEIHHLFGSLQSPEQLHWLLDVFRESYMRMTSEMPFDFLAQQVNLSPYTLHDWLEALQLIHVKAVDVKIGTDLPSLVKFARESLDSAPAQQTPPPFLDLIRARIEQL